MKLIGIIRLWVLIILCINTTYAAAFVVVTRSQNIQSLTTNQVKMLYRGLISNIDGQRISLADLPFNSEFRTMFYLELLGKTPIQMQALRARQNFSGRHIPPYELNSSDKALIMNWLNENPESIIYIPEEWHSNDLKVVYRFDSEEGVK